MAKTSVKKFTPTRFMLPDSRYDKERADHAVAFIENLRHTKGGWAGQPFYLLGWQEELIRNVFGVIKKNGYRQFNTVFIEVPKKSGKSELAAAVALYMLCADGEQSAEIYGCATDRQQAGIVFSVALDMILQCPALKKRVKIAESQKRIIYEPTRSIYQVLSSEVASKYGYNVHACIFDELLGQPNRKLYDVMTKGSGAARKQPLNFVITTAGSDKNSICYEVHSKALDILEGRKHDPTFYPVVYGAPEDADWTDPKVWRATEGNVVHYGFIESFIEELGMKYNIREIAFDRWGAVQMTQNLEALGFTVVPFGQGFKDMSPPTKELMKLTLEEKIAHGGHPVLRWMMDNIYVKTDPAGNIKPDKEKSTERIDGAVALIMALDRALRHEGDISVYDSRGILVL